MISHRDPRLIGRRPRLRRKGWGLSPVHASAGARWWSGRHRMCGRSAIGSRQLLSERGLLAVGKCQVLRPSELHSIVGCALAALGHSGRNQLPFKLSDRRHDVEDKAIPGARGVNVLLAQADKADVVLAEAFEDV